MIREREAERAARRASLGVNGSPASRSELGACLVVEFEGDQIPRVAVRVPSAGVLEVGDRRPPRRDVDELRHALQVARSRIGVLEKTSAEQAVEIAYLKTLLEQHGVKP